MSLRMRRELGAKRGMAEMLDEFARLALAEHGAAGAGRAALLFGAAAALRERIGAPLPPVERAEHDRCVAAARQALGEAAYGERMAAGRAAPTDAAAAYALGEAADMSSQS
jgi:hypothetical protein